MNRSTILIGIVSLILLAVALILGVSATGSGDKAAPLVAQVFAWIAIIIPVLLGVYRSQESQQASEKLRDEVRNGELAEKNVRPAIDAALADDATLQPLVDKLVDRLNEPPTEGKSRG